MKWLIGICVFLALMMTTSANAQVVVNFDDLVDGSSLHYLPVGYAGLDWDPLWFWWSWEQWPYTPSSPDTRIATHNYGGWIGFPDAVVFNGAYFSGMDDELTFDAVVNFELYLGATLVSTSASLDVSEVATWLASGYSGLVDTVVVICNEYNFFAMDDFTYTPYFDIDKTLDVVDDDDGDGRIEVGELVTFTMTINVTNISGSDMTDVVVTDGIGGDLTLLQVNDEVVPDPPETKKKKDNSVDLGGTAAGVSVAWSGKTQKAHLTWNVGDLADGASDSLTIIVATDINPGQTPKDEPVHEFTSAEEDHELNTAEASGMIDDTEVYGISNTILIDIVEPVE